MKDEIRRAEYMQNGLVRVDWRCGLVSTFDIEWIDDEPGTVVAYSTKHHAGPQMTNDQMSQAMELAGLNVPERVESVR